MWADGLPNATFNATEYGPRIATIRQLGAISFYGLLVTIALALVPHGSQEISTRSLLIVLLSIVGGLRIADALARHSFRIAEPVLLAPLLGILGLALIQIIPWPGVTSPISLDPYETRSFILIFGSLIVALEVMFFYTTSANRVASLVALVITAGVGSSLFGLSQRIFLDSHPDLPAGYLSQQQGFAQYMNRNHFALLIEMAFGLLLGILLKGNLSAAKKLLGWTIAGIMAYSAIAANSRGGLISMTALTLFAVLIHRFTRKRFASRELRDHRHSDGATTILKRVSLEMGIVVLVLCSIIPMIAFVGGDTVVTRIEKLSEEFDRPANGGVNRSQIWESTIRMIESAPVFGVGFGAYGTAIPRFDHSGGAYRLSQAHNEYLEVLSNGGIIGFILTSLFGVILLSRCSKNLGTNESMRRASSFGGLIGIFGVLIHSSVDFGLHIPANALVFGVLVVIATANVSGSMKGGTPVRPFG